MRMQKESNWLERLDKDDAELNVSDKPAKDWEGLLNTWKDSSSITAD